MILVDITQFWFFFLNNNLINILLFLIWALNQKVSAGVEELETDLLQWMVRIPFSTPNTALFLLPSSLHNLSLFLIKPCRLDYFSAFFAINLQSAIQWRMDHGRGGSLSGRISRPPQPWLLGLLLDLSVPLEVLPCWFRFAWSALLFWSPAFLWMHCVDRPNMEFNRQ